MCEQQMRDINHLHKLCLVFLQLSKLFLDRLRNQQAIFSFRKTINCSCW